MKIKILLIMLSVFFLSGCYSSHEINELAIVTSLSIDLKGETYEVGALVKDTKAKDAEPILYSGHGITFAEALNNAQSKMATKIYLAHIDTLVISKEVAEKGVLDIIDYLLRKPQTKEKFYVLLTEQDKAKDILNLLTNSIAYPANAVRGVMKASDDFSFDTTAVLYADLVDTILKEGIDTILPVIEITDDKLSINKMAVFKKDKLQGFLDTNNSKGLNILLNKNKETALTFNFEDTNVFVNIDNLDTKIKIFNSKNIEINITGFGKLDELNCDLDITEQKNIDKLTQALNNDVQKLIRGTINELLYLQSDSVGFGYKIYTSKPNEWKKNNHNWHNQGYQNIDFIVNSSIQIKDLGALLQCVKEAT